MLEMQSESNVTPDEDEIERKHFQEVVNAFRTYKFFYFKKLYRTIMYVSSLPYHQQELLSEYKDNLQRIRTGIERNFEIIRLILQDVPHLFENKNHSEQITVIGAEVSHLEMEKVQNVFRQVHREWSEEGKIERADSFQPILDEIFVRFPERPEHVRILVPGAGLGRLPYEIAKKGYVCQGNELSLYMLFVSNFILNKCSGSHLYKIYPWVTASCNHLNTEDQFRAISFPDESPSDISNSEFSMSAGNFVEIYTAKDDWDCIATCFFLDTAYNIIDYIEVIWKILKPGGYWINLGPLLYHHADIPNQDSIEPSYEEIRRVIEKIGFIYLKEQTRVQTSYCQNPNSMLNYVYNSVFFVCEKPVVYNA